MDSGLGLNNLFRLWLLRNVHSCIHELGFGVKMSFCRELDLSRRCVFYSDFYSDKRDLALLDILFQHLAQFRLLGGKWKWGPILAGNPTHGLLLVSFWGKRLCQRESESCIVWCLGGFSGQLHWSVQGINIFSRDLALGLTFGESLTKQSSKPYICLFRTVRNTQVWNKSFPFCSSGS